MNEFSTYHLDQDRQDNARCQSEWSSVMHANQPYPGKLHQAVTKAAYEMQSVHEVENHTWSINLQLYISSSYPMTWGTIPIGQSKNSVYTYKELGLIFIRDIIYSPPCPQLSMLLGNIWGQYIHLPVMLYVVVDTL